MQNGRKMYILKKNDFAKASELLARSFIDYPIFKSIIPDDDYRNRKIRHLFRFLLDLASINGQVIAPSSDIEGVSIWIYSVNAKNSMIDVLRAGLLGLLFQLGPKTVGRLIETGECKQEMRSRNLNEPYVLLDMIAVDPRLQRRGYGRQMIEWKLAELDKIDMPCYLETSDPGNIEYYGRFGFSVLHEYELNNIHVYCLFKRPKPRPSSWLGEGKPPCFLPDTIHNYLSH
jgi:hypothetical protein